MAMLRSLLILLVVFTLGNAEHAQGSDRGVAREGDRNVDKGVAREGDRNVDKGVAREGDRNVDKGVAREGDRRGDKGVAGEGARGVYKGVDRGVDKGARRGYVICPSGWKNFGNQCYKYFSQRVKWIKAEQNCQGLGGHLVSVSGKPENDFLLSLVPTSTRCWIGANDAVDNGSWLWSDGSSSQHRNWCSGEPNNYGGSQDCVELNLTSNRCWNDESCSTPMGYICAIAL